MSLFDLDKIRKLPPDKRIKALEELKEEIQKLIEERKKEIEDAQFLLEEAEDELKVLLEIETPKAKKIVIEDLFTRDEKAKEKVEELERIAREEGPSRARPTEELVYINSLRQKPVDDLYNKVMDVYKQISHTGIETLEQRKTIDSVKEAIYLKEKDMQDRKYNATETVKERMSAIEKVLYKLSN